MPFTIGGEWIPSPEEAPQKKGPRRQTSVRLERRKHTQVTVIRHLPGDADELRRLASLLKRYCSCGGTVKNGVVEIQGDKVSEAKALLAKEGIKTA